MCYAVERARRLLSLAPRSTMIDKRGLSKEELQIAEERHKQLMKQSNISSSHLVTKRCGDLYTSFHLIRDNVDADDFIEVCCDI
uniref:Uncharacterized protein n=1 Tax=Parascaris univalens TaxID=6257 RepID=A0A915CKL8_PARUN